MAASKLADCNDQLPVGEADETYLFHQFMALVTEEDDGSTKRVAIPLDVAYPRLAELAKAEPRGLLTRRLDLLKKDVKSFVDGWKPRPPPDPVDPPIDVYVDDVSRVLAVGEIHADNKTFTIADNEVVTEQLRAGQPVMATMTPEGDDATPTTLRLIPTVSSIDAVPQRVEIEPSDVSFILDKKRVQVPGAGVVEVELGKKGAANLLRHGYATVTTKVDGQTGEVLLETASYEAKARVVGVDESIVAGTMREKRPDLWVHYSDTPDPADSEFLSPSFVVYVPIVQHWDSQGYDRGTLLNTFSLLPREEVTVEVFSWDRTKTGTETTLTVENQRSVEATISRKLTDTVVDTASHSWGWQFGANAGFQVPQINLNLMANFSIDDRNETSQQHTVETINDGTVKAATMLKSSLQTKVTEAREFGLEERTIRKFQNPNAGRILHVDCFEVLHHFEVTTEYDFRHARLCLLLPFADFLKALDTPDTKGRAAGLLALEGLLFDSVPERLRNGFDAARQFLAWDRLCEYSCDSVCECAKPPPPVATTTTTPSDSDTNPWQTDLEKVMKRVLGPISDLRKATGKPLEESLGPWPHGKAWKNCTADERAYKQADWHRFLFRRIVLERQLSGFWSDAVNYVNLGESAPFADRLEAFERMKDRLIPSVADFLSPIFAAASIPLTAMDAFINGLGEFSQWVMADMMKEGAFDDAGLQIAMIRAIEVYDKWNKFEIEKKHPPPSTTSPPPPPPPDTKPSRRSDAEAFSPEALAAASVAIDALVSFLLVNRSVYRVLIFNSLNPTDRMRFLGLLGDVGKYVRTTVLGFVGDSIAVEVDPEKQERFAKWLDDHLATWKSKKARPTPVALPVPGMTAQTRLESCDALEPYLTKSREIELARLRAVVEQQEHEAARLKARLEKGLLEDPDADLPVLKVETSTGNEPN
jgi:hypothetical protein